MRLILMSTAILLLLIPAAEANNGMQGYADLVEKVQGAVVNINTVQERSNNPFEQFFNQQRQQRPQMGAGTGFIISEDGYIVTNRHVVDDSTEINVSLTGGRTYPGKLIGTDDRMDVAVIKIEANNLTTLDIGNSDQMRIGDAVLALGYPLSLGFSVTSGIISGIGRNMTMNQLDFATYIQTDADITFGNSGGPLVNNKGEVIALNTMIVSRGETFGFSIPSNLFMNSVNQLIESGEIRRGALGVGIGNLDAESLEYYKVNHGARITSVTKGTPAAKEGLKTGDIITEINGQKINSSADVVASISSKPPGTVIKLKYVRDGNDKTMDLKLADRNIIYDNEGNARTMPAESEAEESEVDSLGFTVIPLTRELRRQLELDSDTQGVIVESVDPDSMAARKNLRSGTLIWGIGDTDIRSPKDLKGAIKKVKGDIVPVHAIVFFGGDSGGLDRREVTFFLRKN